MATGAEDQHHWLIEPLVAAGMELDEIRALVARLAAETLVVSGAAGLASVTGFVDDRPPEVRAAWTEMIGRMLALGR